MGNPFRPSPDPFLSTRPPKSHSLRHTNLTDTFDHTQTSNPTTTVTVPTNKATAKYMLDRAINYTTDLLYLPSSPKSPSTPSSSSSSAEGIEGNEGNGESGESDRKERKDEVMTEIGDLIKSILKHLEENAKGIDSGCQQRVIALWLIHYCRERAEGRMKGDSLEEEDKK